MYTQLRIRQHHTTLQGNMGGGDTTPHPQGVRDTTHHITPHQKEGWGHHTTSTWGLDIKKKQKNQKNQKTQKNKKPNVFEPPS